MTRVSYDENGIVQNENQLVKLPYDTLEWHNFWKNHRSLKLIKMEVEKVLSAKNGKTIEEVSIPEKIKEEVRIAFYGEDSVQELTEDQKRIAELERKIAELTGSKKEQPNDELTQAREDYVSAFGKKGHHSWTVEQIREKIAEKD